MLAETACGLACAYIRQLFCSTLWVSEHYRPERLHFLGRIFSTTVPQQDSELEAPVVQLLPPFRLLLDGGHAMRILEGMERRYAPLNDWIHGVLREHTTSIIPNDLRYSLVFDKLEILIALSFA